MRAYCFLHRSIYIYMSTVHHPRANVLQKIKPQVVLKSEIIRQIRVQETNSNPGCLVL